MEQRYIFSGHESFPCKSLWLKKGYDFVVQEKNFSNPDAVIDLGVGKNMVASIHYWLRVFKICKGNQPTWLGRYLFDETNGKDKYIEDLATLWLLHFSLVFGNEDATLYNMAFCGLQRERTHFDREQILTYVKLKLADSDKNDAYSFDLVTNRGTNVRTQTYVLPEKDKRRAKELEEQINPLLSGDTNVDVCTLLAILNKKLNK